MGQGIVGPFGPHQETTPCGWFLMHKGSQILLDDAIHGFRLSIKLRMVSRAHMELSAAQFE